MPFTHYANTAHECSKPTTRDDGSPLQVGDEWACDYVIPTPPRNSVLGGMIVPRKCGTKWRWTGGDQREPDSYWAPAPVLATNQMTRGSDQIGPYGTGGGGPYS